MNEEVVTRRINTSIIYAIDFSRWKRSVVCRCFPGVEIVFITCGDEVPEGGTILVWGMRPIQGKLGGDISILRVEDGFLRSVGLGVDLIQPMSWVVDGLGIYYDATRPSDLEVILSDTEFSPELRQRAACLLEKVVAGKLTKYNIGASKWQKPSGMGRVILVPGQVETDASLIYGAPAIRTNLELLKQVRKYYPKEYILYKPHPDVLAGLRTSGSGEEDAGEWCDEIVKDVAMGDLLMAVDEVHVLTSLAGFEALLRGKSVTCYGQPFYSGWGLTKDIVPIARRVRRLSLTELVAGVLILYPIYLSRLSEDLISPEKAIDELLTWRKTSGVSLPWWRQCFRLILRLVVGVR